mgnify:CR=1 FL=1
MKQSQNVYYNAIPFTYQCLENLNLPEALLVDAIGKDGEGDIANDILQSTFERDLQGMDEATASSEMRGFLKALQTPSLQQPMAL